MKPRYQSPPTLIVLLLSLLVGHAIWGLLPAHAQGQVQVTAADPFAAEQGTINLNVKVTGKGFKNGAQAKWFVTGTTNPGGVTVNSTTFVSSSELTANITVAETADIANFDIQVLNSDGRGGKGTELFAVTAKGAGNLICPPQQPAPTTDTKCYAAQPGCLDSTFGGVGFVHPHVGNADQYNVGQEVVVQADGKLVVASGRMDPATSFDIVILRYNADGSLDTSFGDPNSSNPPLRLGYTITTLSTASDTINGLTLQPDGKIVVCGSANGLGGESVVMRYTSEGTLDATFGNGGIVTLNFGKRVAAPNTEVAVQADGKIVIGGSSDGRFAVVRLLPNGSVDLSFGSNGIVFANASGVKTGLSYGISLALQRVPAVTGEERIILGGHSKSSSQAIQKWALMRFKPNGVVDTGFGGGGIVKTDFSGFDDGVHKVIIDSNNRIIAAGNTASANFNCGGYVIDSAIVRYNENGSLDLSFGGGKQIVDLYGGRDELAAVAAYPDNKIVILDWAHSSDFTVKNFALVKFNADGSRDFSFGILGNGVVTTDFAYGSNSANSMVLQPNDGKIVALGTAEFAPVNGAQRDIVTARYWP